MSLDGPLAEFEIGSGVRRGSRLSLYANRLVHHGGDAMEAVPLNQLAAVRVAFERDPRKLSWAVALLLVAIVLSLLAGPLQSGITALAASIKENAGRGSMDGVLLATFSVLGGIARLLPTLAAILAAIATGLLFFFWLGLTTLTLSFAAVEREYAVWGRNPFLIQFAEVVAAQLAARKA